MLLSLAQFLFIQFAIPLTLRSPRSVLCVLFAIWPFVQWGSCKINLRLAGYKESHSLKNISKWALSIVIFTLIMKLFVGFSSLAVQSFLPEKKNDPRNNWYLQGFIPLRAPFRKTHKWKINEVEIMQTFVADNILFQLSRSPFPLTTP